MKDIHVYFLSAKELEPALAQEIGCKYPYEIFLGPDSILASSLAGFDLEDCRVFPHLVVKKPPSSETKSRLNFSFQSVVGRDFDVIQVPASNKSLEDTYRTVLRHISKSPELDLGIILPADVLMDVRWEDLLSEKWPLSFMWGCSLFMSPPKDSEYYLTSSRWTVYNRKVPTFIDRTSEVDLSNTQLFTGASLHTAKTAGMFLSTFKKTNSKVDDSRFLTLYLNETERHLLPGSSAHDFGHLDSYWTSRFQHLSSRSFNRLSFNPKNCSITKTSSSKSFSDQVFWYQQAPENLEPFLPQVFKGIGEASLSKPSLSLEALPFLPVSELIFHPDFNEHYQEVFVKKLVHVTLLMSKSTTSSSRVDFHKSCHEMYFTKTMERLDHFIQWCEYRSDSKFLGILNDLKEIRAKLPDYISKNLKNPKYSASFMHGDLCLSNILFDMRTCSLKLIDPRGLFGKSTFGDRAYEIAKFLHSTAGFDVNMTGLTMRNKSLAVSRLGSLREKYMQTIKTTTMPLEAIERGKAIVPLLFLSMLFLHIDHIPRVELLAKTGIELFNRNNNG